jgi:hypothetical protein
LNQAKSITGDILLLFSGIKILAAVAALEEEWVVENLISQNLKSDLLKLP